MESPWNGGGLAVNMYIYHEKKEIITFTLALAHILSYRVYLKNE